MNTVKEFEDLGVEFVDDDKFVKFEVSVTSRNLRNNILIESFAWRPMSTLPDNPAFSYEMECSSCDSNAMWRPSLNQSKPVKPYDFAAHVSGMFKDIKNTEFKIHKDTDIAAPKPVFTQAMADAGDRVKVGMLFSTATGKYTALMVNDSQVVFERGSLGFVVETHAFIHPIDTRTDKEKAVDEAIKLLKVNDARVSDIAVSDLIGAMYDLELLK
jgi:hypothetical protein